MELLFFPLVIAAMWFFLIRPQQQRLRNQRALLLSLEVGDEVVTVGGIIGTITAIRDREMTLDVGKGNEIRVVRTAVSARMPGEVVSPVEES